VTQAPAGLRSVAEARGYTRLQLLGGGLEFLAYEAVTPEGSRVALRAPAGNRFESNANDPAVDTRSLLRSEYLVARHVAAFGIPVASPRELVLGDPDVLINDYLPDGGRGANQQALGELLCRLHRVPAPPHALVASEGLPAQRLLPQRIARRWRELAAIVPDLSEAPDVERMAATLAGCPGSSLVHLDVRAANLRCEGGQILGLLDWSNALVADPALELGRLTEFALLPENGVDLDAVLAGYGERPPCDHAAFWVYRLDAAVMLALVFTSEAPDERRGALAVDRLREVRERLLREWDR
jgi:aminoglycoside phosphotransferase (APT) family kinase protein